MHEIYYPVGVFGLVDQTEGYVNQCFTLNLDSMFLYYGGFSQDF